MTSLLKILSDSVLQITIKELLVGFLRRGFRIILKTIGIRFYFTAYLCEAEFFTSAKRTNIRLNPEADRRIKLFFKARHLRDLQKHKIMPHILNFC
jgi:hypothetical protein